jgi:hypothetical protein
MTGDEQKATEVLARTQRAWSPGPADGDRVRRAIGAALAAGASGSVPIAAARAPGWTARLLAAGTIAAASGGIGYWAGYRAGIRELPSVAQAAASPLPTASTVALVAPSAPEAQPSLVPSVPTAAHHGGHSAHRSAESAAPVAAESLAVEVRALRNAERALRDGNPGLALVFLDQLDRDVPKGQLTEERDAAATLARCARGDRPIGVDLAGDFAERHPGSVYQARVGQACAATDSPATGDSARRRSGP